MNKATQVKTFSPMLSGIFYAFISLAILTLLTSIILKFSSMKESSLDTYVYFIHGLSLFVGGFISGKGKGNRGWYYGGLLGIIYGILILMISFLGFDSLVLTAQSIIFLTLSFFIGALGGIFGVNFKK
ncbi:TIGR04086 family membrane protein [Chengkuizengella axinellae]|uniref:TIGR04086 family membrane protein n=1 Tax=Chengkuizengella axinellae TaxID=3064388 RepID=A0ABT9ITU0_9BACL|nr:TIGR04086 family membrane protein [Chengkuizengella sp. 2205SS18-9]MDP5272766.1 TIGR04086 family membrane protein [Chengkuizengella sp. 2205SS18-9]